MLLRHPGAAEIRPGAASPSQQMHNSHRCLLRMALHLESAWFKSMKLNHSKGSSMPPSLIKACSESCYCPTCTHTYINPLQRTGTSMPSSSQQSTRIATQSSTRSGC